MDKRLEKIRNYKGTVLDFDSYVKDKIKETKDGFKKDADEKKKIMSKLKESVDFTCEEEPTYSLARMFGSPADIICYVTDALRETNQHDLVEEYRTKAVEKDFNNLLLVSMDYLARCNGTQAPIVGAPELDNSEEE